MSMEMGQAVRYTLSEAWEKEGAIWPEGSTVYVVPLTPQPDETMVDVFLTDRAEDAIHAGEAPNFRSPSEALFIEDGHIRLRRDEDNLHP